VADYPGQCVSTAHKAMIVFLLVGVECALWFLVLVWLYERLMNLTIGGRDG
jgi:hypothetical protein